MFGRKTVEFHFPPVVAPDSVFPSAIFRRRARGFRNVVVVVVETNGLAAGRIRASLSQRERESRGHLNLSADSVERAARAKKITGKQIERIATTRAREKERERERESDFFTSCRNAVTSSLSSF